MAAYNGDEIFLVWKTDKWHSTDSRELVYIGTTSLDDCVAQIHAHRGCTTEQAGQLLGHLQSQCTGNDFEWEIEKQIIGTFVN